MASLTSTHLQPFLEICNTLPFPPLATWLLRAPQKMREALELPAGRTSLVNESYLLKQRRFHGTYNRDFYCALSTSPGICQKILWLLLKVSSLFHGMYSSPQSHWRQTELLIWVMSHTCLNDCKRLKGVGSRNNSTTLSLTEQRQQNNEAMWIKNQHNNQALTIFGKLALLP